MLLSVALTVGLNAVFAPWDWTDPRDLAKLKNGAVVHMAGKLTVYGVFPLIQFDPDRAKPSITVDGKSTDANYLNGTVLLTPDKRLHLGYHVLYRTKTDGRKIGDTIDHFGPVKVAVHSVGFGKVIILTPHDPKAKTDPKPKTKKK